MKADPLQLIATVLALVALVACEQTAKIGALEVVDLGPPRSTDTERTTEDTRRSRPDTGTRRDTAPEPDSAPRPDTRTARDTSGPTMKMTPCGLPVEERAVIDGILRSISKSFFETLGEPRAVMPAVAVFPGDVSVDFRVPTSEYDSCSDVPSNCREQPVSCHQDSCYACHLVSCSEFEGKWTVDVSVISGPSTDTGGPLEYSTSEWHVRYPSAPHIRWKFDLAFEESPSAEADIQHEILVTSRRTAKTYEASFRAEVRGEKDNGASQPSRLDFTIHINDLAGSRSYRAFVRPDNLTRPTGELEVKLRGEDFYEYQNAFTVKSAGDRVDWDEDCSRL